jgi:hypothetical protein
MTVLDYVAIGVPSRFGAVGGSAALFDKPALLIV